VAKKAQTNWGSSDFETVFQREVGLLLSLKCPCFFGRHCVEKAESSQKLSQYGTKVCRYNWHSAGFLGWPFSMLKYKYIFQIKYTGTILSNSTRKLLWFDITKMLIAV